MKDSKNQISKSIVFYELSSKPFLQKQISFKQKNSSNKKRKHSKHFFKQRISFGDFVGFAKFNSNKFSQTNSLLNSHKLANKVWGKNLLDKKKVINDELTTIDSFVEKHNIKKIDILKIDTQGSEYLVLKGAKESLKRGIVKLIYTEIIMLPTYENQLDFDEFIKLMKSFGFRLFNLYNLSLTKEGELRQVDALFLQQTSSKKVVI